MRTRAFVSDFWFVIIIPQALVPISVDVEVPFDFHRYIIGSKGRDVRKMMEDYDVNITVPPATQKSNFITIKGTSACVHGAKIALEEKVEQLEKERQDRVGVWFLFFYFFLDCHKFILRLHYYFQELRKFELRVEVDPKYHPKIIGRKGAVITKIRQDNDVGIQFPERGDAAENIIIVKGYEKNAEAARDAILDIVSKLVSVVIIFVLLTPLRSFDNIVPLM